MLEFNTNKPYVLIKTGLGDITINNAPIIFGDSREELEKFCKGIGFLLHAEETPLGNYAILPTEVYRKQTELDIYTKFLNTVCEIEQRKDDSLSNEPREYIDINKLSVGDTVMVPHDYYGVIEFICIGKNHDGENTATLMTKYVIDELAFDAAEPDNNNPNRQKRGNNRYNVSNLLDWMNSYRSGGDWYMGKHIDDQSPDNNYVSNNPYVYRDGLLHGFSKEFIQQLVSVIKTTAKNTVTDGGGSEDVNGKVFLLSATEVGLFDENNIAEGTIYEYFSKNNIDDQRIAYYAYNTSDRAFWWLRTPYSSVSDCVRYVDTRGMRNYTFACNGCGGLRFGLVIKNI